MKNLCILVALMGLGHFAAAAVLYTDDFDGTGNLAGTTPDVTPTGTETWIGSTSNSWQADGTIGTSGQRNMFLPFTIGPRKLYTFDLDVSIDDTFGSSWFALGFKTAATPTEGTFFGTPDATPWMLQRSGDDEIQTFASGLTGRLSQGFFPGDNKLTIQVDTQDSLNYGAKFYVNDILLSNIQIGTPALTHIAFGTDGPTGSVDNLSFTSQISVPEPSSVLLLGLGVGLLRLVKRRSRIDD